MFAATGQAYIVTNFLYDSRFIGERRHPRLWLYFPYMFYPAVAAACVGFIVKQNGRMMDSLDRKYTPIWLDLSKVDL